MASVNHKALEFGRLRKLVDDGRAYSALKDLHKLAAENNLGPEQERIEKIKDNIQYLDNHLKAESIDPMFARTKRNGLMFEILELIDGLEERNNLKVTFKEKKDVNLILDTSLGLNEEKKKALVKSLGKILGVSGDNIGIEEALPQ
ncbi:MAG: hypothetical protein R2830_25200 [Saprospiraceae bacterium]